MLMTVATVADSDQSCPSKPALDRVPNILPQQSGHQEHELCTALVRQGYIELLSHHLQLCVSFL
jgi:hypothetical protein